MIDIVIPVYNGGSCIRRAVTSALNQATESRYSVHVIDNASTDDTVDSLEAIDDQKLQIHRFGENVTMWENHNRGFRLSDAEHVCFLHADDALEPYALDTLLSEVARDSTTQPTIYWGYSKFVDFSSLLTDHGMSVGVGFSGERAFLPFSVKGLSPSGVCFPRFLNGNLTTFIDIGVNRFPSDSISLIDMAIRGARFKMMDSRIVDRCFASTGAQNEDARKNYFSALDIIFEGVDHAMLRRIAQHSIVARPKSGRATLLSDYFYEKGLVGWSRYHRRRFVGMLGNLLCLS